MRREVIGQVFVDSGLVMLVDPCYVLGSDNQLVEESYEDVLKAFEPSKHEAPFVEPWGHGLGIVVGTLYGDGAYNVYAEYENGSNRPSRLTIEFDDEPEEEVEDEEEDDNYDFYYTEPWKE